MSEVRAGFGWIEVGGERYEHDIVIHTDGRVTKRQKKLSKPYRKEYGHTPLSPDELLVLNDEKPGRILIGTGHDGSLPIMPEAMKSLRAFETVVKRTPELLPELEALKRGTLAIVHVTC